MKTLSAYPLATSVRLIIACSYLQDDEFLRKQQVKFDTENSESSF